MYSIHWSTLSEITFAEEIEFILKKWNQNEVDKFGQLVQKNLEMLSKNPLLVNCESNKNIYSFLISKQTTLYYKVSNEEMKINLILFWNNKKNPKLLDKYINH